MNQARIPQIGIRVRISKMRNMVKRVPENIAAVVRELQ